jgi:putative addiction module killer protein
VAGLAKGSGRKGENHVTSSALELGNAGDHASVGNGVSELRIHSGPGYRVYYKQTDKMIVVILCGGDKSTQDKDIKRAKEVAAEL